LISWVLALRIKTQTGYEPLGTYWWDNGLQSALRTRSASTEVISMVESEMLDLKAGRRECLVDPPPSAPVQFDAMNATHMLWLLSDLDGRAVTGGRLSVRLESSGTRQEMIVEDQTIY
jgi:hypothetical protein